MQVRLGLILSALIAALDQASKWWIVETVMRPPRIIPLTDFFNLVLGLNRGVSFGMLDMQSPMGRWILAGLALTITAALLVWMWRANKLLVTGALGLIVAAQSVTSSTECCWAPWLTSWTFIGPVITGPPSTSQTSLSPVARRR